jgi:hypothetical protein
MLYAILCYNDERRVFAWNKEEEAAAMARIGAVLEMHKKNGGKFGPVARLMPTTAATSIRKDGDKPFVIDGPFAETKEQLLGLYVVDCDTLDAVHEFALALAQADPGGTLEIRPFLSFSADGAV